MGQNRGFFPNAFLTKCRKLFTRNGTLATNYTLTPKVCLAFYERMYYTAKQVVLPIGIKMRAFPEGFFRISNGLHYPSRSDPVVHGTEYASIPLVEFSLRSARLKELLIL